METALFPREVRTAIVGSGFSGLGMAIRLKESGDEDFLVLERRDEVGGTWRDNHYPGAACDVPSRLYSFSFAPNPGWSRSFSEQPEILAYLKDCADRFDVRPKIRFGCALERATWDETAQRWRIETSQGPLTAQVLVSAAGALSEPKAPELPGVASFAGTSFHTADWDHSTPLTGKRVAVVGTGASAIQVVPEIQSQVAHLDLYQRTPAWVIPRTDRGFTRPELAAYRRFPALQKAAREAIYWTRELYVLGFTSHRRLMAAPRRAALANLRKGVKDPEKRRKLTPSYEIGCKRILISNDFYPALDQPNADVITSPIREVRPHGIVTADGVEHPADVIVWATGFQVTPPPFGELVVGRDGRTLGDLWREEGMRAHRGTTFPGFPNLFQLTGPNTGLGHTSMVYVIEAQVQYVLDAIRTIDRDGIGAVEPRRAALEEWNARVQGQLEDTVWTRGGCASWYLDQHGTNVTLWPDFTFRFKRLLERFDRESYEVRPVAAPAEVA